MARKFTDVWVIAKHGVIEPYEKPYTTRLHVIDCEVKDPFDENLCKVKKCLAAKEGPHYHLVFTKNAPDRFKKL